MKPVKLIVVVLALTLVLSLGALQTLANNGDIIARVNGVEITQAQFYEALEREAGAFILSQIILDELISQKQVEYNVYVNDDELTEVLFEIIDQLGGIEGLQMFLQQNQINEDQLIEQVEWNLLISKLTKAEVIVTDEEVEAFFNENKAQFAVNEQVEASHILVDSQEKADEILALLADQSFAALARQYSVDPGSGANGGYLGVFGRGMMVPSFEDKAFSLKPDEIGVVESDFGFHIILVMDRIEAQEADLENAWASVKAALQETKAVSPGNYLDKLMSTSDVEIQSERYRSMLLF